MRKYLFSLLSVAALLALAAPARAQYTIISGTVIDPDGFHYSNGSITAIVIPASTGPWKLAGFPYGGYFAPTALDANGSFSARIADNNQITPSGTQWLFTVCGFALVEPIGTANQCFTLTITVTGSSQDLSAALNAVAPRLTNITTGFAHALIRGCVMRAGSDNGAILVSADIAPQSLQCPVPADATLLEIDVQATSATGTPNVIVSRVRAGVSVDLTSSALATNALGAVNCSKASAATGIAGGGTITCIATLQNTALLAGDVIATRTATADGAATVFLASVFFR